MNTADFLDEPNQNALRPIVYDAATRNGMLVAPFFRTSDFINAVMDGFKVKNRPGTGWGRDVLDKLDYVASAGSPDQWIYLGMAIISAPKE